MSLESHRPAGPKAAPRQPIERVDQILVRSLHACGRHGRREDPLLLVCLIHL